jgi:osmotically-inducible protein OsmY
VRDHEAHAGSVLGIVLTAVGGFAIGAAAGMALGGAVGKMHRGRVRATFGRFGRAERPSTDELARAVLAALREDEATSDLDLDVHVAEPGLVELTGVVSDAIVRRVAGDVARAVPGVEVVVNRIMLRGTTPPRPAPHLRPI